MGIDLRPTRYETWNVWDERLPEFLVCAPPDTAFIEWMREGQMLPIGVNLIGSECTFLFGNRRLWSLRALAEEEGGRDTVEVAIYDVDKELEPVVTSLENSARSDNPLSDYAIIDEMVGKVVMKDGEKSTVTYKDVAKIIGRTTTYVRKLHEEWHGVPKWVIEEVLKGTVSPTAAKAIAKLGKEDQKLCKLYLKENGNITKTYVDSLKKIHVDEVTQTVMADVFQQVEVVTQFYPRSLLESVCKMMDAGEYEQAHDILRKELG